MIYLDANATEPLREPARDAALAAMGLGNPSSIHQPGRAARRMLEESRETVAEFFGAKPADVIFCSGATEANALAIHALGEGRSLLFGATEHDAVRAAAKGGVAVPVRPDGTVDRNMLETLLAQHPGALLCLMAANNETGVLHDIAAAAQLCARHGAWGPRVLRFPAINSAARWVPARWWSARGAAFPQACAAAARSRAGGVAPRRCPPLPG
jgi:cysteine desulfurase